MNSIIFACSLVLLWAHVNVALPTNWYKNVRTRILHHENQLLFGGNLTLNHAEEAANAVLMESKKRELQAAFDDPSIYAPGQNFLLARESIEKSQVFQLIRRLPKGAVLHAHDTAIVSTEYVFGNLTYRDNLYVCQKDDTLTLQFFKRPNKNCEWELLRSIREDPVRAKDINEKIYRRLTMLDKHPGETYADVNKAWVKFQGIFGFLKPLLTYKPIFLDHLYRGLEELYEDNVMYIELRTTLPKLYELDGTVYSSRQLVRFYLETIERFKKTHPDFFGLKLIYAPRRSVDRAAVQSYVNIMKDLKKEFPNLMAGFDLVGQEDKGKPLEYFADILLNVDANINFFFHAGETNWWGASTDENLVDALLLNTKRIGHGYALSDHPFLLEVVKRQSIAIEVNPISNQVLALVGDLRNHAARRLFAEGYPVVISNDDPGLWGARALSYDFYEAFMALMSEHSDLRALKQLALNSLSYSSMNEAEKSHAMALWEGKWNAFVDSMGNGEL